MRRHCSSRRKPRWHLQVASAECLERRASCLSRHSSATCSRSEKTAASLAQRSRPRYRASQRGSARHKRWASMQSAGDGIRGKLGDAPVWGGQTSKQNEEHKVEHVGFYSLKFSFRLKFMIKVQQECHHRPVDGAVLKRFLQKIPTIVSKVSFYLKDFNFVSNKMFYLLIEKTTLIFKMCLLLSICALINLL